MTDITAVCALLQSSDAEQIREGARRAGEHRIQEAVPALVAHLGNRHPGVLDAVERALRTIGGPEVIEALLPVLRSEDPSPRNLAMDILRLQASEALARLVKLLHDQDADMRIFAADLLGYSGSGAALAPLCRALRADPEANVRCHAAASLGSLGRVEAIPCLCAALQDEEWVQYAAAEALAVLDEPACVPFLLEALATASDLVASTIVDALGSMGNVKSLSLLLNRLSSAPDPLRSKILKAIIRILGEGSLAMLSEGETEKFWMDLRIAAQDEDTTVQDAAMRGLAALQQAEATQVILDIGACLDREKEPERFLLAVECLVQAGFNVSLAHALRQGDEPRRALALEALGSLEHPAILPLLKEVFWETSRDLQRQLAFELANRAGPADQAFMLDILQRHRDGIVLRGMLLFLGTKASPLVAEPPVLQFLDHPYRDVRESALAAALALDTPGIRARLKTMAGDNDAARRAMGIHGLGRLAPDAYLGELRAALRDAVPEVRKTAVEALGWVCPISGQRLALIEGMLRDGNREVRLAALESMGSCSEKHLNSSLVHGLKDPDVWVRARCAEQLGERRAVEAVEALLSMLEEDNSLVVIKVVEALGSIGGKAAFVALLGMLRHAEPEVRSVAEATLERLGRRREGT